MLVVRSADYCSDYIKSVQQILEILINGWVFSEQVMSIFHTSLSSSHCFCLSPPLAHILWSFFNILMCVCIIILKKLVFIANNDKFPKYYYE